MCTASHNPKRYTGAKLVRRGAVALSGDAGIGEVRGEARSRPRRRARRRLGRAASTSTRSSRRPRSSSSTPARSSRMRVVVDGGNGMAGPMVGPLLERLGLDLIETYWEPDGALPRPRAEPAAAREPRVHHRRGRPAGRGPRDRLGRRRRPLLLHRRPGRVRRRRLPDRAARRVDARKAPRRDDPLRRPRQPGGGRRHRARRRPRADEPRRPRVLQDADARGGRGVRRRGLRPLLLPRLLLRRLGHDPGAADPRAALAARRAHVGAARAVPLALLHLRRDQLRGRRSSRPRSRSSPPATHDGRQYRLDGISVEYDDWHFNVRPSNTEPLLRLCLESLRSHEDMERRRDEVLAVIRS